MFDLSYNEKYVDHVEIDLSKYNFMLVYSGEIGDIAQYLKKIQEEEKKYHDKLIKEVSQHGPISVIPFERDESLRSKVFEQVCLNPGINAEKIGEKLEIDKEEALLILKELKYVDRLVSCVLYEEEEEYKVPWYRK